MNIALVRRGFSATGGAEAYLLRLAAELSQRGHELRLITSGDWPEEAWPHGPLSRLPGHTPTAFANAFARLPRDYDVSLALDRTPGCDVFRAGDGVHAAWLERRSAFEPAWKSFLRRWSPKHGALLVLERRVFATCRHVIANSRMVAREITRWHDVPPGRIEVIPNGLSAALPAVSKARAREQLRLPTGAFVVLFAGTGWERKGLRFAVEAADRMPEGTLLLAAGRGFPARFAGPRVRLLGPKRDLAPLFSAADVFVLPTLYDPFSNACLEALAAGLPVVTTTANGFSEIIEPGRHGSVVEPGDAAALAEALASWRGREAGDECRALAAQFTIARNAQATLALLEAATNCARQKSGGG
ncbi:MAG: glycosyltransferase family 4 protein [Terrimicrobiaceae bacterium]|nr:glycosyltransferase family 4 protein [Terrimicrobiaceae bacterium]